jgi:hypothetical protein
MTSSKKSFIVSKSSSSSVSHTSHINLSTDGRRSTAFVLLHFSLLRFADLTVCLLFWFLLEAVLKWKRGKPLPQPRDGHVAVVYDRQIILLCGGDGNNWYTEPWSYDLGAH